MMFEKATNPPRRKRPRMMNWRRDLIFTLSKRLLRNLKDEKVFGAAASFKTKHEESEAEFSAESEADWKQDARRTHVIQFPTVGTPAVCSAAIVAEKLGAEGLIPQADQRSSFCR